MLRELLAPSSHRGADGDALRRGGAPARRRSPREQAALLNRFGRDRRMVVTGCAGSGKTMLAIERGKRARRRRAQACCSSASTRRCSSHLRERAKRRRPGLLHVPRPVPRSWRSRRRSTLPKYEDDGAAGVLERGLPAGAHRGDRASSAASTTTSSSTRRRTCTPTGWRRCMHAARRAGRARSGCSWTTTSASTTATLDVPDGVPAASTSPSTAATPRRSTTRSMKLYTGEVVPEVVGPAGRAPELFYTDDQPATVAGVIERLCGQEEVPPAGRRRALSPRPREVGGRAGRGGATSTSRTKPAARRSASRRSAASRASSRRSWSSASSRTSTRTHATSSSTSGCRGRATTA